ncbi:MAG: OadG family transporter subunit [Syntrophomonadaceae bacterium]|nr:OadG family transporter subunit [Syntrophomonadaceae bacterium]
MSIVDALLVSLLGLGVVFLVLISLSILIKILSVVLGYIDNKSDISAGQIISQNGIPGGTIKTESIEIADSGWSAGELKLIGVDEKTAAMIMAIVSDESKIPLSELQFKTIRLID